jgi:hypothetical protein
MKVHIAGELNTSLLRKLLNPNLVIEIDLLTEISFILDLEIDTIENLSISSSICSPSNSFTDLTSSELALLTGFTGSRQRVGENTAILG